MDNSISLDANIDEGDRRSLEELRAGLGGDYEVLRVLGHGAMARVFLAKDRALGVLVAVKVLRSGKASDETARKRFEREARAAASLSDNPHAVAVTRFGRLPNETPYLVMQYVKGRTMEERLKAEGGLAVPEATSILLEVASALAAAHEKGIIHRDVRLGNVLWDEEKHHALLTDFGIAAVLDPVGPDSARLTQTGQLLGDPHYMSPEQLMDGQVTELSDMYLFGVLGYELISGQSPYTARTAADWIRAHLQDEPRDLRELRPDVPEPLADLLRRCLAREPRHRPSAKDAIRALSRLMPGAEGSTGAAATAGERAAGDLSELVKRRVPQIVLVVAGLSAGLIQLVSSIQNLLPHQATLLTVIFSIAAVLASAVIAWFHGERGHQQTPVIEYALLGVIGLGWLVVSAFAVLR